MRIDDCLRLILQEIGKGEDFFKWSSYILAWLSFALGVVSLFYSYRSYIKADKASVEAEQVNSKIVSNDRVRTLAEDWAYELKKLEPSGRKRADGLITLLTRISNSELIDNKQRIDMQRLSGTIKSNIDDVDKGLFHTKLHNDMNEAVGIIEMVIDSLLPSSK